MLQRHLLLVVVLAALIAWSEPRAAADSPSWTASFDGAASKGSDLTGSAGTPPNTDKASPACKAVAAIKAYYALTDPSSGYNPLRAPPAGLNAAANAAISAYKGLFKAMKPDSTTKPPASQQCGDTDALNCESIVAINGQDASMAKEAAYSCSQAIVQAQAALAQGPGSSARGPGVAPGGAGQDPSSRAAADPGAPGKAQ